MCTRVDFCQQLWISFQLYLISLDGVPRHSGKFLMERVQCCPLLVQYLLLLYRHWSPDAFVDVVLSRQKIREHALVSKQFVRVPRCVLL